MNIQFNVFKAPEITPFTFSTPNQVYEKMKSYGRADREIFLVLHMNAKNGLIKCETQSIGTVGCSAVYPREIVKSALMFSATSIICLHNHPSGDPKPSEQDKVITENLVCGCLFMGLELLDHIIIGRDKYFSFSDEGLIWAYNSGYKNKFPRLQK